VLIFPALAIVRSRFRSTRTVVVAASSLVLVATAAVPARQTSAVSVLVLVSDGSAPYKAALGGLQDAISARVPDGATTVVRLTGMPGETRQILASVGVPPDLIVPLGTAATRAAIAAAGDIPIVAAMILTPAEVEGGRNATGVYLEHPIDTELQWLTQILPHQRRIGILYHTPESATRVAAAEKVVGRSRLTVRAVRVGGANDIPVALASLAKDVDVIFGLADPLVFNAETVRAILTFSFRERIPVVGPSLGWVRAGAIYALQRNYSDVGRQAGEMALKVLAGQRVSTLPPVPPRAVTYAINTRVASELRIVVPDLMLRSAEEVVR
jgi:putative tryptophan/tyrosine transport system substrate-binding protein